MRSQCFRLGNSNVVPSVGASWRSPTFGTEREIGGGAGVDSLLLSRLVTATRTYTEQSSLPLQHVGNLPPPAALPASRTKACTPHQRRWNVITSRSCDPALPLREAGYGGAGAANGLHTLQQAGE